MPKLFNIVLLLGVFEGFAESATTSTENFAFTEVLEDAGNYTLFWNYNQSHVTFEVHVKTQGWVAFGISGSGKMFPGDVVVGWVTDSGTVHFSDRHTIGHSMPIVDKSQDWHLLFGQENEFGTVLKFVRKISSCDKAEDKDIPTTTTRIIYAYGDKDPDNETSIKYHGTARGTKSISLLKQNYGPAQMPSNVKHYDFLNDNYVIPAVHTTYWCRGYLLPDIGKHHIIKYEPIITPGNEMHVHHMLVYRCRVNNPAQHHGKAGLCHDPRTPDLPECTYIVMAWAVGGKEFYFPDNVGFSIGGPEDENFYILETHYDNPTNKAGMIDDSGFRITITSTLRPIEAGMMEFGHAVDSSQIVPPHQSSWVTKSYCSSTCINQGFSQSNLTEIKVFGAGQHAHLLGVSVTTRHYRNGVELKPLVEEPTYDFNFQELRLLPKEVSIYPGDSFRVECTLDSTQRSSVTLGGYSTRDEMCLAFVYYYPKMKLSICTSLSSLTYLHIDPRDLQHYIGTVDWKNQTLVDQIRYGLEHSQVYQGCYGNELKHIRDELYVPSEPTKTYILPPPDCS